LTSTEPDTPGGPSDPLRRLILEHIGQALVILDRGGAVVCASAEVGRVLGAALPGGALPGERGPGTPAAAARALLQDRPEIAEALSAGRRRQAEIRLSGAGDRLFGIDVRPISDPRPPGFTGALVFLRRLDSEAADGRDWGPSYSFSELVGQSRVFRKAVELGKKFADTGENVLILGESGTGKELFARAIHNRSRFYGPFVAVNCAALPRSLIESELFGYVEGSFTGARRKGNPGKIELAQGGTLFLDEIGDMPAEVQAVLLRVIEDKLVMRVGGDSYRRVNCRIVAATNKDPQRFMAEGLFRDDLYFRLSTFSLPLPPLREREGDALVLARYFLVDYCRSAGLPAPALGLSAETLIRGHHWPGNARQLKNAIIYAVNVSNSMVIERDHFPPPVLASTRPGGDPGTLAKAEREAIARALAGHGGNMTRTAAALGIAKATLYRKVREHGLEDRDHPAPDKEDA
jgi:transcriptional regulator with PAS, ATPase and Fis domain